MVNTAIDLVFDGVAFVELVKTFDKDGDGDCVFIRGFHPCPPRPEQFF
jgi:hypothetical protein